MNWLLELGGKEVVRPLILSVVSTFAIALLIGLGVIHWCRSRLRAGARGQARPGRGALSKRLSSPRTGAVQARIRASDLPRLAERAYCNVALDYLRTVTSDRPLTCFQLVEIVKTEVAQRVTTILRDASSSVRSSASRHGRYAGGGVLGATLTSIIAIWCLTRRFSPATRALETTEAVNAE
jgi:hypothetical protein